MFDGVCLAVKSGLCLRNILDYSFVWDGRSFTSANFFINQILIFLDTYL